LAIVRTLVSLLAVIDGNEVQNWKEGKEVVVGRKEAASW